MKILVKRQWLIDIRNSKKMSQMQLSKITGIAQHYISMIETGQRGANMPAYVAKKIAKALDFDWTRFYE